jgi:oligopeptide/dipeptide ABC transporter ATP-binding protein
MCDKVAVMYLGKIVECGTAREIYKNPQHPYTRGLMGSVHKIGTLKQDRLFSIDGTVPLALNLGPGCGFYDRCTERIEGLCDKVDPTLSVCDGSHCVACHRCNPDVQAPSTAEAFTEAEKAPELAEPVVEAIDFAPEAPKADKIEAKTPLFDEPEIAEVIEAAEVAIPAETNDVAAEEAPADESPAIDAAQAAIDAAAARKQAYISRYNRRGHTKGGRR